MSGSCALPQLTLGYEDLEGLQEDLERNLRHGRAFVAGAEGVEDRQRCQLVLVHPESGDVLSFEAEAVWVRDEGSGRGVGVQICEFGDEERARLEAFACEPKPDRDAESIQQRVRRYAVAQQMRRAREGELIERIALERAFGKAVWEPLLQNPRVTVPEVSRIARKGNIPTTLLEAIATNAAWLSSGELRRALLTNPRLKGGVLEKVLRALPKSELKLAATRTGYPIAVRQLAKKLLPG